MFTKPVVLLAFGLFFATTVDGYKILAVFPTAVKSRYSHGLAMMMTLHNAGHDVTLISPFELKNSMERYRDITVDNYLKTLQPVSKKVNPFEFSMNPLAMIQFMRKIGIHHSNSLMQNEKIKNLLSSKEKFDVVFVEMFYTEALFGFGQHFDCPVIAVTPFDAIYWSDAITGNQSPMAYIAHTLLGFSDRMSFAQRLMNVIVTQTESLTYNLINLPTQVC